MEDEPSFEDAARLQRLAAAEALRAKLDDVRERVTLALAETESLPGELDAAVRGAAARGAAAAAEVRAAKYCTEEEAAVAKLENCRDDRAQLEAALDFFVNGVSRDLQDFQALIRERPESSAAHSALQSARRRVDAAQTVLQERSPSGAA